MIQTVNKQEILKKRADALAQEKSLPESGAEGLEVVIFSLGSEHYGIESCFIQEVYPLMGLTPLPGTPAFVEGLIHIRRRIYSVVNLKKLFDLPATEQALSPKALVLQGSSMEFAIAVDDVLGVRKIKSDTIQNTVSTLTGIRAQFLKGITQDRLIILDGYKMMTDKHLVVEEQME